jgi:hypothetical protein
VDTTLRVRGLRGASAACALATLVGVGCSATGAGDAAGATDARAGSAFDVGFVRPEPARAEEAPAPEPTGIALAPVELRSGSAVRLVGDLAPGGRAAVVLHPDRSELCVRLAVRGLGQPTAAHLRESTTGGAGAVVLALHAPPSGDATVDACVTASSRLLERIRRTPSRFAVSVNTEGAPDGAVWGRLR